MANMINVLNTILANASTEYQTRVPTATIDNLTEVGKSVMSYTAVQNEFISLLVNKVALTIIHGKIAKNPLAILKKGSIPLGENIEEIFVNPATGKVFDPTGANLLSTVNPDVKVIYHVQNREGQYKVTIRKPQLIKAFTSFSELEKLLNYIVNSLYSGDNIDEFILMKNLFASAITGGKIKLISTPYFNDTDANIKSLAKAINTTSLLMTFPSTEFNSYKTINPTQTAVNTWTPIEEQVIIIRADAITDVNMTYLATQFNMEKADLMAKIVPVDTFGTAFNCYAVLCDASFVQVFDNLFDTDYYHNPEGKYDNYYLNHWQTYSLSLFANAVAFVYDNLTIKDGDTEITTLSLTSAAPKTLTCATVPAGGTVVYSSSNAEVATFVDGVVTAVVDGTCTIKAKYGATEKTVAVTVAIS
jgi:hypothetical protein